MSGALCIDFGTSSIRAVRRLPSGKLKTLDIGRVTKSKLDDASIRSEIHVDEHRRYVRFGERAVIARNESGTPSLYDSSPKLWLKEPNRLGEAAAPGLGVTREQLLAGLLAYAIRAAADADEIGESTLKSIDIRIAHPVWPVPVTDAANAALARICAQAQQMAFQREWGTVTVTSLLEHAQVRSTSRLAQIDVLEPVAAAAELLPSEENLVRMCAVVDVGAGTTDIGLFLSLVPDGTSKVHSKLYRTGQPVSVFKAGNVVDEILLKLLQTSTKKPNAIALADVRARIRGIKETLFRDGFIQELGCDIHLNDLQSHPEAKAMAAEIREEMLRLVKDNAKVIANWMDKPFHSMSRLDVVMAGGGAGIDFLLRAINQPIQIEWRTLHVKLTIPGDRAGVNTFGASRGRMAVALGGASNEYDTLVHEQPKVFKILRGSL